MAKRNFSCPTCSSEFCSAITWWKPKKEYTQGVVDAYLCHDCGQLTEAGTGNELPIDWLPPRITKIAQPDLFGTIANIRDTITDVPKLVETPAGIMIGVYRIPEGSSKQYIDEIKAMLREIDSKGSQRVRPDWYKYRKIKRRR